MGGVAQGRQRRKTNAGFAFGDDLPLLSLKTKVSTEGRERGSREATSDPRGRKEANQKSERGIQPNEAAQRSRKGKEREMEGNGWDGMIGREGGKRRRAIGTGLDWTG
jgi:hypothetical protein